MITKYKIQILAVLMIILVVSSPMLLLYYRTKNMIISEAGEEAKNIASSIAIFLERDLEPYKALNNVDQTDVENFDYQYYQEMLAVFQELKLQTGANYIFTEKLVSEEAIAYILDSEPVDSETFSPLGTLDGISESELEAFQTGLPTATKLVFSPGWGNFITGFAPIRSSENNQVIGLVGVDFSANYILSILKELNSALILLFVIITSMLSCLVLIIMNRQMRLSNQDFLTGLNNRRFFEETLRQMIKLHQTKQTKFSLLIIDIDKFKQINDTYGHGVGDLVLKRIANLICTSIKETDFLFRYGGDEFIVILPDTTQDQATFVAKRLTAEFFDTNFRIDENQTFKVCVSVGVAEYSSDLSIEQFLHKADEEMYRKKTSKQTMPCL